MTLHESIHITDWFYITFIENMGMAFGMQLGSKILLSLFRVAAICVLGYYIWQQVKKNARTGYIVCLTLIAAGAAGNIIDCLFYGLIFNTPPYPEVADFQPYGYGYGEFLYGKVVDMFYFPLVEWDMPTWMPIYSGQHCVFFSPIFNFADAAISCGIVALLIFYHKLVSQYQIRKS